MSGKRHIPSIEINRPDGSLDSVVVDLDETVCQEELETIPVVRDVGQGFAERGFCRNTGAVMREPNLHVDDKRCRPFLSPSETGLRIKAAQFGFDPVQVSDPLDTVLGNGCCSVRMRFGT